MPVTILLCRDLAALLRRVIFIGQATISFCLDFQRVGLAGGVSVGMVGATASAASTSRAMPRLIGNDDGEG